MIKTCPETLRWIVYEIIAILGFYGNVLWGTLWHHIRRWKPFFQTHHTYMCDTSFKASFQALFKTGFRLKIFPLEVVFFRSRNVHVWGTCLPKIVDSTYFQKNWRQQPLKTTIPIVSYINLTVISSSIQNFFQIENIPTISIYFDFF